MFDIRITKNRTCLLVQPSTPSTIKFLSIAYLSLLDYLAFLYTGLRLSWLGAPVAWYWEQAGPHGPSLHLAFLKVPRPRSIWSSSRFRPGSLTISTLHF